MFACQKKNTVYCATDIPGKDRVKQGYLLSSTLSFLAIDWIMKTTTAQRRNRIQWTMWKQLEDR